VIAAVCIASVGLVALAMNVRRLPLPAGVVLAIGGLTYPLYLLHQHIGYMLFNKFAAVASAPVLVVSAAALVTAASFLIWRFFEKPVQKRFKQRLTRTADWLSGIAVGGAGFLLTRAKRFGLVRPEGAA
jgi:peptidoglycan/LPS O-acetylase OafA/YrhL